MKNQDKISIFVAIALIFIVIAVIFITTRFKLSDSKRDLPVNVEVFLSFDCEECGDLRESIETLKKEYSANEVQFDIYYTEQQGADYSALISTLAAEKQGKRFEYEMRVYEKGDLSEEQLISLAEELSLKKDQFIEDRNKNEIFEQASEMFSYSSDLGITKLPEVRIEGKIIADRSEDSLKEIIDTNISEAN